MSEALVTIMDQIVDQVEPLDVMDPGCLELEGDLDDGGGGLHRGFSQTAQQPFVKICGASDNPPQTIKGLFEARVESAAKLFKFIIERHFDGAGRQQRLVRPVDSSISNDSPVQRPDQQLETQCPSLGTHSPSGSPSLIARLIVSLSDLELSSMLHLISNRNPDLISALFFGSHSSHSMEPPCLLSPLVAYLLTSRFEQLERNQREGESSASGSINQPSDYQTGSSDIPTPELSITAYESSIKCIPLDQVIPAFYGATKDPDKASKGGNMWGFKCHISYFCVPCTITLRFCFLNSAVRGGRSVPQSSGTSVLHFTIFVVSSHIPQAFQLLLQGRKEFARFSTGRLLTGVLG